MSETLIVRRVVCSALALGASLSSGVAWADDAIDYASVGVLVSIPIGAPLENVGLGVEASFTRQHDRDELVGYGAFVQAQYLLSGGWRLDAGGQGNFAFAGAELGVAVVAPHANDVSIGLHVAPFLSAGYGGVGFRWTPRLSGTSVRQNDFAITATAKLWWDLDAYNGPRLWDARCTAYTGCFSTVGRPLMVEGGAATAAVVRGATASDATPDAIAASYWERAMLDEHAAIAAFARVSLALMALGAPLELVARTHAAALDEVDHARRCAALASRFAGRAVSPGALPESVAPFGAMGFVDVAVATLLEGCVNEGAAAEVARVAAARAEDPAVRASLDVIARDEARHAALAWDTVAWCCEVGGDDVRRRLADALDAAPRGSHARVDGVPDALRALGVTDDALAATCRARALRVAHRRVGRARPVLTLAA